MFLKFFLIATGIININSFLIKHLFKQVLKINKKVKELDYNNLSEQELNDFTINKPNKITVWSKDYVVWKNENNSYVAIDNVCNHRGASLALGKISNGNILCPYHGYEFNENGTLVFIPGICFKQNKKYDLSKYRVIEKHGWIYLNIMEDKNNIFIENIFVEPEANNYFIVNFINMFFNCYSRILSENSLDVMHISFVHSFGNKDKPNPEILLEPTLISPFHYKTSYSYKAGNNSIAKKIYGFDNITIENEFILPQTTIARVIFGNFTNTVMTFALPINEKKSKFFVKTYRNYWNNSFGNFFTHNTMINTIFEDKSIVENIDPRYMDGSYNMRFDKLQNVYKTFYKNFIHNFTMNNL